MKRSSNPNYEEYLAKLNEVVEYLLSHCLRIKKTNTSFVQTTFYKCNKRKKAHL